MTIRVGERPVTLDDLVRVARQGAMVELTSAACARVAAARMLVERLAATPEPIYYQLGEKGVPVPALPPEEASKARGLATRERVYAAVVEAGRAVSCAEMSACAAALPPHVRTGAAQSCVQVPRFVP